MPCSLVDILTKLHGMTFQEDYCLHIHWHENLTSQLLQITFQIGEIQEKLN